MNHHPSPADQITPLILTYNEEVNIERTLTRLEWARRIVIIDSFSNDKTLEMIGRCPQAVVLQRKFDSFDSQTNYGLSQIDTEWVLSLDADYVLSKGLFDEMSVLINRTSFDGFLVPLTFCVDGFPLKCSVLPPRICLFRRNNGRYYQEGHAHRLELSGTIGNLRSPIHHDDRKPYSIWLQAQSRYAVQESHKLSGVSFLSLRTVDKWRALLIVMPVLMPVFILIFKRGIMDGRRGFYYAYLRSRYEIILSLELLKRHAERIIGFLTTSKRRGE